MNSGTVRRSEYLLFAALLLLLLLPQGAAAEERILPASFREEAAALGDIQREILPAVDEAAYRAEDQVRLEAEEPGPWRFAAPHYVHFDPAGSGTWEELPGEGRIWRIRIASPGARSLNFGLTSCVFPEGSMIHFYTPDGKNIAGPYGPGDITEGEIWTPVLPGDETVVELFVPEGAKVEPNLAIAQVNHDYRGFLSHAMSKTSQGYCNNDVICPEGDPWRDEIRSVGVYTLQGYWTCSGQMVNSLDPEPPPYFLTAYHCGINTSNDQTMVLYWNYESPTCGMLGGGSLSDHQSGAVLRARYSTSDFCLVELAQEPDTSSHVYYSGWDATNATPSSCVAIHHPSCDEKAISFNNDALRVTSYFGTSTPGDGTHLRVDDWEDGTTEPGSSGSGIWNPYHRLVGQLHGGNASCYSITDDWYGRLYTSWTGGGTAASRLSSWLDPDNTGTLVLDGWDPQAIDTDVALGDEEVTRGYFLSPNAPNPFNPVTRITYSVPAGTGGAPITLAIYDATGRMVRELVNGAKSPGTHAVTWDGTDNQGEPAASGVYFYRMNWNEGSETRRLVLVR